MSTAGCSKPFSPKISAFALRRHAPPILSLQSETTGEDARPTMWRTVIHGAAFEAQSISDCQPSFSSPLRVLCASVVNPPQSSERLSYPEVLYR